jgi:Zn-finger nucleic acid-binding protein
MDLTCPKCQGSMRSYERSGVTVDQCSDCRGIFLDRGELERLIDADGRFHEGDSRPAPTPQGQPMPYPNQPSYGYGQRPHKRRKSFFEELFD